MNQEIVLFHSAYGLRTAVREFAAELRQAGHQVHTPDLFDGQVVSTLAAATSQRDAIGVPNLIARAQAAVAGLPPDVVFAGFSMGTGAAEFLAATRPGAKAAVLMHGALAPADFGASWPPGVPVQIHYAKGDDQIHEPSVRALEAAAREAGAAAEVHVYERGGHLFGDPGLPDYDAGSASLMLERVLRFLSGLK